MAEYTALAPLFTDIANAIRSKTGETGQITANLFPAKINMISTGTNGYTSISNYQIKSAFLTGYSTYYAIPECTLSGNRITLKINGSASISNIHYEVAFTVYIDLA